MTASATADAPATLLERFLLDPWGTLADLAAQLAERAAGWGLRLLLVAIPIGLAGVAAAWGWRRWRLQRLAAGARLVGVLVPPQVEPGAADALWSNLAGLLRQRRPLDPRPHVSFELHWTTTGMTVGLWVPGTVAPHLVERAVEAAWPGARASLHPATPPLPKEPGVAVVGGGLRLAGGPWQPLRSEHWVDPLRALLGAAGELAGDETAVVQILARPAGGRWLARATRTAHAIAGAPSARGRVVGGLLDLLTPSVRRASKRPAGAGEAQRLTEARAALAKLAGPCWEVAVRYGVAGPNRPDRHGRLRARAHALAAAFAVHTGRNRLSRHRLHRPARSLAARQLHRGDLLTTGELASLAHLPADPAVPGLTRAGARPVPPPPGLPTVGKVLGDSELGTPRPIRLTPMDACQHVHLLGATGSGKSTLLTNLALQDIEAGRGVVVVVDPKGDLVTDLLDRLPDHALQRLVLLDPDERAAPPTLNPLEGEDPDLAVDHLVGILHRIWIAHWGPRIDDVLRASCLTLLRRPGATLTDIPRLLSDPLFRQPYLQGLDDPVGLGGFWAWYQQQSPAAQAQLVGPIMTRLRAFLLRGFVRDVVGAPTSSFDMAAVLDGGICLARLPKGLLGDDTARLLGSFVVARVWQAATARARTGQQVRQPASLYVDECQNFLTLPYRFEELLPEARGYRLALHLAHQHLGQLPKELHDALSANARTKVYFTCSPEDARLLERHVHPHLGAYDLAHLGAYQAAVRLLAGGTELPVCTIRTRPVPPAIPGRADAARAAARARFGRTRQQRRHEALRHEFGGGEDPRLPGPIPSRHTTARSRRLEWPPQPSASPPSGQPAALAGRLGDLDWQVCRLLADHQVLTTGLLALLVGTPARTLQHRLATLTSLRVVERFRPHQPVGAGSAPYHYLLGETGAAILATQESTGVEVLGWDRARLLGLAHANGRLTHLLGVNTLLAQLTHTAHHQPGTRLVCWWPAHRCQTQWGRLISPDAYARWCDPHGEVDFFLHHTPTCAITDQPGGLLAGYNELAAATGITTPVLLHASDPDQEAQLRDRLADQQLLVPVATSNPVSGPPSEAVWLPTSSAAGARRYRLGALGHPIPGTPSYLVRRPPATLARRWPLGCAGLVEGLAIWR